MANRLKEGQAILNLVEDSENEEDAMGLLQKAGYSEEDAECLLDAALEILHIANSN